ncbi:hypothetical protein FOZ62_027194, partial [Perkinsus olseni]
MRPTVATIIKLCCLALTLQGSPFGDTYDVLDETNTELGDLAEGDSRRAWSGRKLQNDEGEDSSDDRVNKDTPDSGDRNATVVVVPSEPSATDEQYLMQLASLPAPPPHVAATPRGPNSIRVTWDIPYLGSCRLKRWE